MIRETIDIHIHKHGNNFKRKEEALKLDEI